MLPNDTRGTHLLRAEVLVKTKSWETKRRFSQLRAKLRGARQKMNRLDAICTASAPLLPVALTVHIRHQQGRRRTECGMTDAPPVWQSVGRGTLAGRALFNLFSDDVNGRQTGDKFSARNKAVLEAKIAMGWRPSAPGSHNSQRPAKPSVNVPKFRKGTSDKADTPLPSGKKSADAIFKEVAERQQELEQQQQPAPQGPLLDDAEKARLAELMRFRGKLPEPQPVCIQQSMLRPGSKAELQHLFDQIVMEVNERQQYLEDMAAFTKGQEYQAVCVQIRREIQDRVKEMKRLDQLLKAKS